MKRSPVLGPNRRQFLRTAARHGLLTILAIIAGVTGARTWSGRRCLTRDLCAECHLFARCQLPQAFSARANSKKNSL